MLTLRPCHLPPATSLLARSLESLTPCHHSGLACLRLALPTWDTFSISCLLQRTSSPFFILSLFQIGWPPRGQSLFFLQNRCDSVMGLHPNELVWSGSSPQGPTTTPASPCSIKVTCQHHELDQPTELVRLGGLYDAGEVVATITCVSQACSSELDLGPSPLAALPPPSLEPSPAGSVGAKIFIHISSKAQSRY